MGHADWYLRTADETFGPTTRDQLIAWAQMGRIQPGQEISSDGETWTSAVDVPFLDMRWSIDIGDGTPRGPFNKQAAQALLASGRLPKGSKLVETVPEPTPEPEAEPEPAAAAEPPAAPEPAPTPEPPKPAPTPDAALLREVETLRAGLKAAQTRAAEAESRVKEAAAEAKACRKAADLAEARAAAVQAEMESARRAEADRSRLVDEQEAALRAKDAEIAQVTQTKDEQLAAKESELAALASSSKAQEAAYEDRIQSLSDEIKRLPASARLAADAQSALYTLMKDEADEIGQMIDAESREIEELIRLRRARGERLLARRQEILRRVGTDAEDMTARALKAHPEDPRTVHLQQELDALRLLQERTAFESERKIRDLSTKLRDREGEMVRLQQQAMDMTLLYRQLQDVREKLKTREKELVDERQKSETARQQAAATEQALLARISALEVGAPGATHQSREARNVKLAPWMGLKR